jgi:ribonuclease HII
VNGILGIDEAGRGPVLGPMVIAIVQWNRSVKEAADHRDIPLEDSKNLTESQRQQAATFLKERVNFRICSVPAWTLSLPEESIPQIEAKVIENMLSTLTGNRVYSDALGSGEQAHQWIKNAWPDRSFTFESGADDRYEWVSAASILAKTARDEAIEELKNEWGDLGSGYPSDPSTRSWLKEWKATDQKWPSFVRTKWSTLDRLEPDDQNPTTKI